MIIIRMVRVIMIWDKVFFKPRVYFDGPVSRNEVLYECSNHIETHFDVVVEILEVHSSVAFEFCID